MIVKLATTGGEPLPPPDNKNPHMAAIGRLGGKIGGKVRARNLSKQELSKSGLRAAKAKWDKKRS